jgi:hypothetical protein
MLDDYLAKLFEQNATIIEQNAQMIKLLSAQNEAIQEIQIPDAYGMAKKKLGEVIVNSAGYSKDLPFIIPLEMLTLRSFCIECIDSDRLIKRCNIGLIVDGIEYFEPDIFAKDFYGSIYKQGDRMHDMREYTFNGKDIPLLNRKVTIKVRDDSTVSTPAFANYKLHFFVKGVSETRLQQYQVDE